MIRRIVVTAAGVLLAAGCTPAEVATPVIRTGSDIRLPLDEYLLTDEQIQLISSAHTVLGRRCLARLGLRWPKPEPSAEAVPEPRNARRYYVLELDEARARGYRAARPQRPSVVGEEPDPEAVAAWTREGGCAVKASRALSVGGSGVDPQVLQLQTFSRMQTDARVHEANDRWSRCMRDAGYTYPDPETADSDPRWTQTPDATPVEIATATADVLCKQRTRLPDTMFAVETALQEEVVAQNRAGLLDVRATNQAALDRAGRILAAAERG
ncbi:hypothetical protein [Actinoplanes subglobosus]|uniref:Lipoprotein n=1 Tax=Actinoplanes subglobosus TaxID=1547892 RepID=A0ABV8ITV3_9ACTN